MAWGGARANAGPKRGKGKYKGAETKVMRIPVPMVANVQAMLGQPIRQPNMLPLYTFPVAAGALAAAESDVQKTLNLHDFLVSHPDETFCVRVSGDSMRDAGILDGDILTVDRSITPKHGYVVVAEVDGEFTVKTLSIADKQTRLLPANPDFAPIALTPGKYVTIAGVVVGVARKLGFR
jgi:DNA polymerase V